MAKKPRDVEKEEAEQNRQQDQYLDKQEKQNPTVGNTDELPPHTVGAEAQTSPHKLPDAPGQPVEGTPTGQDRRGVVSRTLGKPLPYTGPERRKS